MPADAPEAPLPYGALTAVAKLFVRLGTVGVILTGLAAAATVWLQLSGGMPPDTASALRAECLLSAIVAAVFAMCAAGVHAGTESRREEILRERARAAAERARQERRREREAAERAAAEQEAAARAAAERAIAEVRAAAEARAAAEGEDPVARAIREREQEELIARLREDAERRAKEEKVERAILNGTRAA